MVFNKIISRINLEKHKANITFHLKGHGKGGTFLYLNKLKQYLNLLKPVSILKFLVSFNYRVTNTLCYFFPHLILFVFSSWCDNTQILYGIRGPGV
jgi:hypothetical protein